MSAKLSNQEFLLIQKKIAQLAGIHLPIEKAFLIENKLAKLLKSRGYKSFLELYYDLDNKSNAALTQKVIELVTNNETRWFRDKTPWQVLEEVFLPAYLEEFDQGKRAQVRIWSAACSTGQEPYSTAICIDNFLSGRGRTDVRSRFELLATDVSATAIEAAKSGLYDNVSMARGLATDPKQKYFTQKSGVWAVSDQIKQMVEFKQFNLLDAFWPLGSFDIILCRYVTIYFADAIKTAIFQKLAKALAGEGALFLGNSEIFPNYKFAFTAEKYHGVVYYKCLNKRGGN